MNVHLLHTYSPLHLKFSFTTAIRQLRENKRLQLGKEVPKVSLYFFDIKNPPSFTKNLLQLIITLIKVSEYKINKQKSVSFLLPCSKQIGQEIRGKKRPFAVDTKNIGITQINKVKDAYNKTFKTVKGQIEVIIST